MDCKKDRKVLLSLSRRLLFCSLFLVVSVWADGKIFVPDVEPPHLPYQRAILLFQNETETLLLQTQFVRTNEDTISTMGWIVPVPSVPKISILSSDLGSTLFHSLAFQTHPKRISISSIAMFCILILWIVSLILAVIFSLPFLIPKEKSFLHKFEPHKEKILFLTSFLLILAVPFYFFLPMFSHARALDVEVLDSKSIGIYDVQVIRAQKTQDLIQWLQQHSFRYTQADQDVFRHYITNGWVFVSARIRPDKAHAAETYQEGMPDPLVLQFQTDRPVYPLALTALTGTDTQILLYLVSSSKWAPDRPFRLRYLQKQDSLRPLGIPQKLLPEEASLLPLSVTNIWLAKFRDTFTPAQMQQDLFFHPAPNLKPYRETTVTW